jgi:hypothetical protein
MPYVFIQMNLIYNFAAYFFKMHFNIILPARLIYCKLCISLSLRTNIRYKFLIYSMRATCSAHFIPLASIARIAFDEVYKF